MSHESRCKFRMSMCLVGAVIPWFFASDVPALIARQDPVIFNRYHVNHFLVLACVSTPLCLLAAWCFRARQNLERRLIVFRLFALGFALIVSLIAVEVVGRIVRAKRYETSKKAASELAPRTTKWPRERLGTAFRRRPANKRYEVSYTDAPEPERSYPKAPPGFGTVDATLVTDARGFRNPPDLKTPKDGFDVVILGDSFAEGSRVTDLETWPQRMGRSLGWNVYNLAVSGANPRGAVAALEAHSSALKPKRVLLMVYEGNDFKEPKHTGPAASPSLGDRIEGMVETSAIYLGLRGAAIRWFGGVGKNAPVDGWEGLEWMPLAVTSRSTESRYYSFKPKRLTRLMKRPEGFLASPGWIHASKTFLRLKELCQSENIKLSLVYAPSKPHVVFPLCADRIDSTQLHRFLSFKSRHLPSPADTKAAILGHLDTLEHTTRTFCDEHDIEFLSLTKPLRDAASAGQQVYYTYDQHWSPPGHRVAAEAITKMLGHAK